MSVKELCSGFFFSHKKYDIYDNACELFDIPTLGESIYRSRRAIMQPPIGRNRRGRGKCAG
jgi:hypothetical protein